MLYVSLVSELLNVFVWKHETSPPSLNTLTAARTMSLVICTLSVDPSLCKLLGGDEIFVTRVESLSHKKHPKITPFHS